MRYFFHTIKYIWKTINLIREIFLNLIFILIILLIISGYFLIKELQVSNTSPQKGTLVLNIEGIIVDNTLYDQAFYQLRQKFYNPKLDPTRENDLFELTQKIAQAAEDPNIHSITLKLDNFTGADLSSLQYMAKYLVKFKQSNKPIYAIGSRFNQSQYYLASYADEINLIPAGSVNVYGLSADNVYYKTLLDNMKVNTHIFRVGTYKSAIEPFIRNDISPEAQENTTRWLSLMWNNYLSDIAKQRHQLPEYLVPPPNIMLSELKKLNGNMAEYALSRNLIDQIISNYQFEIKHEKEPQVSIYDYKLFAAQFANNKPLIAVVFVNGSISDSQNSRNVAGSQDIVNQLRDIRHNPNIKAVVLRVNSPGGSVSASEAIRSELDVLRNNHIPIVISMGNMAASGGYWISTASDYIVASPNTITGSIGIFGMVSTFENSLASIGVYSHSVTTSPLAINNIFQALPKEQAQLLKINIENGYNTFISLVSKSRKMSLTQVNDIGQGQIWLGLEAEKIGLVDKLGDIDDAIDIAARLAKLPNYQIDWQKNGGTWFNGLFSTALTMMPKSTAEIIFNQLPQVKQLQQQVSLFKTFNDPQNRYAYCLNCTTIH